ncbi:MAG: type II toxin-antitoxin system HicB family antitoxin [Ignavibacteria bacterium]|nr:type II toxin-antitoxin system HicB family antitoxin [Ignavibacteria bacterium]
MQQQSSAVLKKSGNQYLALCLELGVIGSGNTPTTAKKTLREAIESYLEYAQEEWLSNERPVSIKELHEFFALR